MKTMQQQQLQPAQLKKMSKKKILEAQALQLQIALHEWFQQLQRSRDIIHECINVIDSREETWLEHEVAQRHLLEASVMLRNTLVMPFGQRSMRAYPTIPIQLLNPALLSRPHNPNLNSKQLNQSSNGIKVHENLLDKFRQLKYIEYCEKDDWEIYTHKDLITNMKYRLFRNKATGVTQTGEPFSVRMKRIRESLKKESW